MRVQEPRDWRGYIAFVMALGIAVGWGSAIILSASARTPPIGENTAQLLSTIGGAMVGSIATYLGMGRRQLPPPTQRPTRDDDPDEPPDIFTDQKDGG